MGHNGNSSEMGWGKVQVETTDMIWKESSLVTKETTYEAKVLGADWHV